MFETFSASAIPDFQQRYRNTFGWLHNQDSKTLIHIKKIEENRVIFDTKEEASWWAVADQNVQFEFLPVVRGFYNTKNGLYFVSRIAARMWQRGISAHNTLIYNIKTGQWIQEIPSFENLSNIFIHKITPDPSHIAEPIALNRAFAIIKNSVYFFTEKIGTFAKNTIVLTVAPVKQELSDALHRGNFSITIK